MSTTNKAVEKAFQMAGLSPKDIGVLEVHDCFTVGGLLALEAAGFVKYGEGSAFVQEGKTNLSSELPTNATGGLIGFGHYTGGTGVRQAVDCIHQLIGKAGDNQIKLNPHKPYALMISMGGNDRTVTAMIFKKAE
jgi:acetyl-CoA C-acetyltransferase/acetyl-CoA acyltransferase